MVGHLRPASLRQLEFWLVPLPAAAMAALSRFSRLESLCLGNAFSSHRLAATLLPQLNALTALTSLELMAVSLGTSVEAVAGLPHLRSLDLWSLDPLPDVHRLSALSGLTRLALEDDSLPSHPGSPMRLPHGASFPGLARLEATSRSFEARGWDRSSAQRVALCISNQLACVERVLFRMLVMLHRPP